MLHAVQPWLPLLHPELLAEPPTERLEGAPAQAPTRKARRKAARGSPVAEPASTALDAAQRRAARQAYLGLVACWGLSAAEALRLLGEPSSSNAERHQRLDALVSLRRSLLLIAPEPARSVEVLRRPEPAFGGASLLGAMLADGLPAIERVRAHLASRARGPEHAGG